MAPLLFIYKVNFDIKLHTKVDKPLNKEVKTMIFLSMYFIFSYYFILNIYFNITFFKDAIFDGILTVCSQSIKT